jgi:endonuclease/exonuclease/phosphatase (EEP) superfamily protein YafD
VPVVAFTPQVALVAVLVGVAALLVRARVAAAVAAAVALALAACVVPRTVAGGPHPDGPVLRVLSANIKYGLADEEALTDLLRRVRADVLVVQELTHESRSTLGASGLEDMLPHQVLSVRPEADGTGIYARFPLERIGTLVGPSGHAQVEAELTVPGAAPVRITAVHAQSPKLRRNPAWRASLRLLPAATAGRSELLVGDFNATLDHAEMRRLLGHGWADAADRSGDGLIGTWPAGVSPFPAVTLDHVLVSRTLGVRRTGVHEVRSSDHRAVFAVLELPPG